METIDYKGATSRRCVDEDGAEPETWTLEAQSNGGLLTTDGVLDLQPGDGVVLGLPLGSGAAMRFTARVRWVRTDGEVGAWVDFTDLCAIERREFSRWLRAHHGEPGTPRLVVTLQRKFRVRRHGTALSVWIGGRLNEGESHDFGATITSSLGCSRSGALAVFIDVRAYKPSPKDSLSYIRSWLSQLVESRTLLGVVVGSGTVGTMQFGRLVREANAADALVVFDDLNAACEVWKRILEQVKALESACHSGIYQQL